MKERFLALTVLLAVGTGDIPAATPAAPSTSSAPASGAEAGPGGMPGSDRDAHGCIGSAGYSWCAREQRCVRSWELARERGFPATAEAFRDYCSGTR